MNKIYIFLLLLASALLSGCAAGVVAGAAAGGYYVGKDDRTLATITEDATITGKVNTKYARDDLIKVMDINVDTYMGTVSLYGNVPNRRTADRAVELAKAVKGVNKVISRLSIVKSN